MLIPRSWSSADDQTDASQIALSSQPMATDGRFKAGAFMLFVAWCVICYSLWHSIKHYKPRNRGIFNSIVGFFRYCPSRFMLLLPLSLIMIGYEAAIAFDYTINPISTKTNAGWIYGLGYGPTVLILVVFVVYGYLDENEDRVLLRQRRERGEIIDAEIGIVKKPRWWDSYRRDHHAQFANNNERLRNMAGEIGGGAATQRRIQRDIEMGHMPVPAGGVAPSLAATPFAGGAQVMSKTTAAPPAYSVTATAAPSSLLPDRARGPGSSERSESTTTTSTRGAPPTQVRSMLDV